MNTTLGVIELELFNEDAPRPLRTSAALGSDGFYGGIIFRHVIPDFMIQGACPEGTGTGGPGYTFKDEFNDHKVLRGALAMANRGPNTNGSHAVPHRHHRQPPRLDGKHTVFGATGGMDAVDAIEGSPTYRSRAACGTN